MYPKDEADEAEGRKAVRKLDSARAERPAAKLEQSTLRPSHSPILNEFDCF